MLETDFQHFIYKSRYARWLESEQRREVWPETVNRYIDALSRQSDKAGLVLTPDVKAELHEAIMLLEIMPSMRALMTAGPALDRDNVAGYNCAYMPIDNVRSLDEMVYILMCGTGVGFSVENKYVERLPTISEDFYDTGSTIRVSDSKIGWAKAYRELLSLLYSGHVPKWDVSSIRPAGDRLRTFGGRASGPEPLESLFRFTIEIFRAASGRKLRAIEVHDLCCKIADIVVVGGVRRSALISLSDLNDNDMRASKFGQWWVVNSQRRLANNSAVYRATPSMSEFLNEWRALYESKSGERGIFNRDACLKQVVRNNRRDPTPEFGTNPCCEIILRPYQFCNLSEVVVRQNDSIEDLKKKVRLATIVGTIQSTFTDFKYLRKVWKNNCEEERLLGVSLTGIMDHPVLSGSSYRDGVEQDLLPLPSDTNEKSDTSYRPGSPLPQLLEELREEAVKTNLEWSHKLGINQSAAITCVKPSGTVSQLVNSGSGIHGRFAPYYIRRVRNDIKDPITKLLIDQGVNAEIDIMNKDNVVFSFPMKSPSQSVIVETQSALDQLTIWKIYQDHWCEHKPSCTIYYNEDEFLEVGDWVFSNFDKISGLSFLPVEDHSYQQAPYEEITQEEYEIMLKEQPIIDWFLLQDYEDDDFTTGSQELACVGGSCDI
jgi:ribonucleoside-diphosphate reductase alpha chain